MLVEPAISAEELGDVLDSRSGPGIIVTYPNRTFLNEKGRDLIKALQGPNMSQDRRRMLPTVITDLCKELCRALKDDHSAKDLEQQEFRRVVGPSDAPLLLRAIRLPAKGGKDVGAVLIILEPIRQKTSVSRSATDMASRSASGPSSKTSFWVVRTRKSQATLESPFRP